MKLRVKGMSCANCVRHVTEAIQSVPGVSSATVTLEKGMAEVRWASEPQKDIPAVVNAVRKAGYEAVVSQVPDSAAEHQHHHQAGWQLNLWIGTLATASLMLGEWVFGFGMQRWFQWLSFGLATIVQIFAGHRFYRGAWNQLKVRRSNMDTLVALGSTTAYGYSVWALFSGWTGHLYFMEAAAIIALISVGHWFEARAGARASTALRKLLHLAPALARRRNADGSESELPIAELEVSDPVVIRPGDRIPIDGEIIEGTSAIDESMLTGESTPLEKGPGDKAFGGTVNLNGRLLVRVSAVGEDTALAQIIAAVQRAQTSRANIQRLGDRVSSIFVPIVVAIAAAAAVWWGLMPEQAHRVHDWLQPFFWPTHVPENPVTAAFIIAAAVLIVACPCAMGLATPAAIMAGSNAAAERGILIRDGVALEKAGDISAVMFDKTGTLTAGQPAVADIVRFQPDPEDPVKIAALLAAHSNHPLSQAIAKLSPPQGSLSEWQEIRGSGVQAKLAKTGELIRLGSLRWLQELGIDLSPGKAFAQKWSSQGATILGLTSGQSLVGLFAAKDMVKPGAAKVIHQLHHRGLKVYLVTGDNALTAASIARQAGISPENVFAEVRPEQKAELIKQRQHCHERIAFVGDGINDAPALEQADLGIAVTRASDIAREAADIILLNSEIEAVPESLGLARATLRNIKQNLFWAFFYNAAGIPLAALGFISPVLCAAAMGLSDLVVLSNALRLRHWRWKE
jgi:Cu+-exporting ATPase